MNELVTIRRAILSVSDKTNLLEFAMALARRGVEIVSTGGTATALSKAGVTVTPIEAVTGFPEIMHGRLKTLHPKVHGGLLAVRNDPEHTTALDEHEITPIDLVCVNLYPFEETVARAEVTRQDAIENIDIGGPSMIRSASKNHDWVTVVIDPSQYADVMRELETFNGATTLNLRRKLAAEAFARTSAYDGAIAEYIAAQNRRDAGQAETRFPERLTLRFDRVQELRHGENPHQTAALYRTVGKASTQTPSIASAKQHHGKELGYNNINDAAAALALVRTLGSLPFASHEKLVGACVIKHANPCGAALASGAAEAIDLAIAGDPLAAYGGIMAVNAPMDLAAAQRLCREDAFVEVLVAPSYSSEALDALRARWFNLRILEIGAMPPLEGSESAQSRAELESRTIEGGLLVQTRDVRRASPEEYVHKAGPKLDAATAKLAAFMEIVTRALSSNAVAIGGHAGKGMRLMGAGAGQMDRVSSCKLAAAKAGDAARGALAFSDAFFPFADGPGVLIGAGVKTIIHPGGSKRDAETFEACEKAGVTCATMGLRHFRH